MIIIGVRFRKTGKVYYFDPDGQTLPKGTPVIVETARGLEYGTVVLGNREVPEPEIPVKKIIRLATPADTQQDETNDKKEKEAAGVCNEKIKQHGLDMHLVDVEIAFDNSKITFFFTADGRVDFRELVKTLAAVFRMRIQMTQIGVRDEAKKINGMGICGRTLCCATFLDEFQPVSIKMAKDQGLSLNPTKISGSCGRLMCCLKYEEDSYKQLLRNLPRVGDVVKTPDGEGPVVSLNVLKQSVTVSLKKEGDNANYMHVVFPVGEITSHRLQNKNKAENPAPEACGCGGGCGHCGKHG